MITPQGLSEQMVFCYIIHELINRTFCSPLQTWALLTYKTYPAAAGRWELVSTALSPGRSERCRHPGIYPPLTCRQTVWLHVIPRTRLIVAASGTRSYRSFSSGSMQSTFWNRTVMNSSGSAVKTHHLERAHRLVTGALPLLCCCLVLI